MLTAFRVDPLVVFKTGAEPVSFRNGREYDTVPLFYR